MDFVSDEFREFVSSRHSTRDFLPTPVPDEIIEEIIADGLTSPSWSNTRPIRVAVAKGDVIIDGDSALAMGNYFFTGPDGAEVKVEYTFGYKADGNGDLRIRLHHSSMPANDD